MNPKTSGSDESKQGKEDGALEKMAKFIDPPGREISDDELSDPGANIPDDDATTGNSVRKTPDTRKS